MGIVDPATGAVHALPLGEPIGNSFAVGRTTASTSSPTARCTASTPAPDGAPAIVWRAGYDNDGTKKPGQTENGSGTTPTLIGLAATSRSPTTPTR